VRQEVCADPRARVADADLRVGACALQMHADAPARGSELDDVRQKIPDDLLQAACVLKSRIICVRHSLFIHGCQAEKQLTTADTESTEMAQNSALCCLRVLRVCGDELRHSFTQV
jgi:hypothetical protein